MIVSQEVKDKLDEPIDQGRVKTREAGGRSRVSYLETWDVKEAANRIFGYGGWSYELLDLSFIGEQETERTRKNDQGEVVGKDEGWRVAYRATVRLEVGDTAFTDVGYGDDVDYSSSLKPHELAVKEAVSDALKRAFTGWGRQFGLHLYDKASPERQQGQARQGGTRTTAEPRLASEAAQRKVMAAAGEASIDDETRHRLVMFLTKGRTQSVKELLSNEVTMILDGITFYAGHTDDAETQMQEAGYGVEKGGVGDAEASAASSA